MINTVSTLPLGNLRRDRSMEIDYPLCCGDDVAITREIEGVVKRWKASMESQTGLPALSFARDEDWKRLIVHIVRRGQEAPPVLSMNENQASRNAMKETWIKTIRVFCLTETRQIDPEAITDSLTIEGEGSGCTMTFQAQKDSNTPPTFSYTPYKYWSELVG